MPTAKRKGRRAGRAVKAYCDKRELADTSNVDVVVYREGPKFVKDISPFVRVAIIDLSDFEALVETVAEAIVKNDCYTIRLALARRFAVTALASLGLTAPKARKR